jgi:hypothetical protein
MLDHLDLHPEWPDSDRHLFLGRIVERFPHEQVVPELRRRLDRLGGPGTEAVLRLIAIYNDPALLDHLTAALERQCDLAPEWAWEALSLLVDRGLLDAHP